MDGYKELANAIIIQAVKDYRNAMDRLRFTPNDRAARYEKRTLEKFFCSDWFTILTDLDGEVLLEKLKKEVA